MRWICTTAGAAGVLTLVAGCGATTGGHTVSAGGSGASNVDHAAGTNHVVASRAQAVTLTETGSSLLYPLFTDQWIQAYKSVDPSVTIEASSTGSGTGISQAVAGTVNIGASDAYMADQQVSQNQGMLNIPLAISAQQVMYNLPGVHGHLHLTGNLLAKIYQGKIQYWDDPAISAANPGLHLPHLAITPVTRSDGSGDTFLFTQFLSDTNPTWKNGPGYGTSVNWPPVHSEVAANGNQGVVTTLAGTKGAIGYVGISWLDNAVAKGLGYAALQNKAGNFVLPTETNIQAAADAATDIPKDERISLIDEPGQNSYPIINFEYAIVNQQQRGATGTALKHFLEWAIDPQGGNAAKYMTPVHFLPLPSKVEPLSQAQIQQIGG
ncbi:MAG: phosphate ABC transporter substrate-binding protein PstS [Alicyclobacillus sp.]|nr:phosphate ABC transporter substrate-binding protein PstS [Alicyclobacillus sp.]